MVFSKSGYLTLLYTDTSTRGAKQPQSAQAARSGRIFPFIYGTLRSRGVRVIRVQKNRFLPGDIEKTMRRAASPISGSGGENREIKAIS